MKGLVFAALNGVVVVTFTFLIVGRATALPILAVSFAVNYFFSQQYLLREVRLHGRIDKLEGEVKRLTDSGS